MIRHRFASAMRRSGSQCAHRRSGYVLVLFAMLVFGMMGLAALVIDLGFARLTQQQMKVAADAAALEGLRFSDVEPDDLTEYTGRTSESDEGRRQAASDIVVALFDDGFDPSADNRSFGAGPLVEFSGGHELNDGFFASQTLTIPPGNPLYKPVLELNLGNEREGDIFPADANTMSVCLRRDSTPSVPGALSNGGPVPWLFGRGSLLASGHKATGIQLGVRSTASAQPVVRIGEKPSSNGTQGGIPFAIARDDWEALPAESSPQSLQLGVGIAGRTSAVLREIGQPAVIQSQAIDSDGYCAIVEEFAGTWYVIGFGWARVAIDPSDPVRVLITKHRDTTTSHTVAPQNATARLSAAWTSLSALSADIRQDVITANQSFEDPLAAPILDPEN